MVKDQTYGYMSEIHAGRAKDHWMSCPNPVWKKVKLMELLLTTRLHEKTQ
jgi:hypothetical protein